ncbi:MAG: rane protein [Thermomicrobiales bacterium]|jgi:CBS-domain-containing membrane protein|nr:rane protein [Thermomicrobiales bacterium]MEA2596133.1 rane protein [Thermomicrobiales bacterium]
MRPNRRRVGVAALSLGLTSGVIVLLKSPHPPTGATTLIFSLGVSRRIEGVAILMVVVGVLTLRAIAINRLTDQTGYGRPAPHPSGAAKHMGG